MSQLYNELCNMLIRPTRQTYHLYDLGNPMISTYGKRDDFQILSRQNLKIKCSFYQCNTTQALTNKLETTVVYLHSLNGSRLEFLSYTEPLLKLGFNIATLDFGGCGLSDGKYVTLGAHEKQDVLELVKYVYKFYKKSNFIIWGRSMGAVAAIKFFNLFKKQQSRFSQLQKINVQGMVLDSPFISLNQLAVQIAKNKIRMPQILIKMAFLMIQNSIQHKANFKTSQLQLENQLSLITIPTLILTSKKDTLVSYEHSLAIYNKIPSTDKQLVYIDSEHNCNRKQPDIAKVYDYLLKINQRFFKYQMQNHFRQDCKNQYRQLENRSTQKNIPRSLKKYVNLSDSKDKLNKYRSQKHQLNPPKLNNFFLSHAGCETKSQINRNVQIFDLRAAKIRQFSQQKTGIELDNEEMQVNDNLKKFFSTKKPHFFGSQKRDVCLSKQKIAKEGTKGDNLSKYQSLKQKYGPLLDEIPQKDRPLNHTTSYKNIECLKTVKKIKRLEPNSSNRHQEGANNYHQAQLITFQPTLTQKKISIHDKPENESQKNHFNVITAKLKKKGKKGLTKSFFPNQISENQEQKGIVPEVQKALKKEFNSKSYTLLQSQNQNRYKESNQSFTKIPLCMSSEKPSTPQFFSSREILMNRSVAKPFTPQFPLNSSLRVNECQRSTPKEYIAKMLAGQSNDSYKGIRTTLNMKPQDLQNKEKIIDFSNSSIKNNTHQKTEFITSKKMLSSQIMVMKASNSFQGCKNFIINRRPVPPNEQSQKQTSISIK